MSEYVNHIQGTGWEVIIAFVVANLIAQFFKILTVAIKKKTFKWTILFATGGMPSSHSSTVVSMATSIGLIDGFDSTTYALAVCFATVVMFDAAGLRRNASKQAMVLNRMIKELLSPDSNVSRVKLKEFLGHTPTEVLVGALLGVAVSLALHFGPDFL
ncbi:MAG: divergent PAP2 family protein [Flavobacteriales bacterium]|nr:divergent PAP2 family protein [Flavobacteriales bacterium]